jgi:UDPglucose 6-dehydrogenase
MKIAVIGLGFVGLTLSSVLASKGITTVGIDLDKEKCSKIAKGTPTFFEPNLKKTLKKALKKNLFITDKLSSINNCDFIFITVGTPQKKNGEIDLSFIKTAVRSVGKIISKNKKKPIILIKSTVIPGTMKDVILPILEKNSKKKAGKDFGLISNPEFLQESNAIRDTIKPHVIVLGGYRTKFMNNTRKFFSRFNPNTPIIITNHQTAEMIKYANNSFLATKISFINQIASICQAIPDTNIDDIAATIGLDPRIGNLFLNAGPGYGGSCLPKDMNAIINLSSKIGVKPTLLNAVERTNKLQISNIVTLIKRNIRKIKGKKIAVLGVAFKPDTDDIRDSTGIELVRQLMKLGANVTIHDPRALDNARKIFHSNAEYTTTISSALKNCQCVIIMTQWKEYEKIDNKTIKYMNKKFIIDSRRILSNKNLDAKYYAIGLGQKI